MTPTIFAVFVWTIRDVVALGFLALLLGLMAAIKATEVALTLMARVERWWRARRKSHDPR